MEGCRHRGGHDGALDPKHLGASPRHYPGRYVWQMRDVLARHPLVFLEEAQDGVGWGILVMLGGVTTLGGSSSDSGLARWLVDSALGGLADLPTLWILILISAFTIVIHLMLPINPVIIVAMIPPIMLLAEAAGANPALYALPVAFTASCAFLLPLDAVPLITYSKGYYKMTDMFLPGAIISVVWVIVMTVAMMLIAPLVGIL